VNSFLERGPMQRGVKYEFQYFISAGQTNLPLAQQLAGLPEPLSVNFHHTLRPAHFEFSTPLTPFVP